MIEPTQLLYLTALGLLFVLIALGLNEYDKHRERKSWEDWRRRTEQLNRAWRGQDDE